MPADMRSAITRRPDVTNWLLATPLCIVILGVFIPFVGAILRGRLDIDQDFSRIDANSVWQIVTFVFLATAILLALLRSIPLRSLFFVALPALLMLGVILLSTTWSLFPDLTLRRGIRQVMEFLTLMLLAASAVPRNKILKILFNVFVVVAVLDLLSLLVPSLSWTPIGFSGVHWHKNYAGQFFVVALPIFLIALLDRSVCSNRALAVFSLAMSVPMFLLTESKTSFLAFMLSATLVVLITLTLRPTRWRYASMTILGLSLIGGTILLLAYGGAQLSEFVFGDSTFTGRDMIWKYTSNIFADHTPEGVGYGAMWLTGANSVEMSRFQYFGSWYVRQAHNGYLDILVQLGYAGALALLLYLAVIFRRVVTFLKRPKTDEAFGLGSYALFLFFALLISNITETSFFTNGAPTWMIFVIVSSFLSGCLAEGRASARHFAPEISEPSGRRPSTRSS